MIFAVSMLYAPVIVLFIARPITALPLPFLADTSELFRRAIQPELCSPLDLDDTQSLPGWPKLEKYARDTWGDGEYEIIFNPYGHKDKPATTCVAGPPVIVNATGSPNCRETRVNIPTIPNTNTVPVNEGFTNTGNWNITNVTTAAHAEFFEAMFQLPEIKKLSLGAMTASGAFINAPDNSFITTATNVTIHNVDLTPVPDQNCIGTILDQQCIIPAEGRIRLVASGYIWFHYNTKRAPLAHPKAVKHSRYAVKIEDVLRNETDRSAWIDFKGYMNTSMRYDYFDECRWNFKL